MLGQTLLHYEITTKLGQGGMGEVYRATDTKLDREVAIKVLPTAFAQDKERLARFEREAKVLAQLNHGNIASVHGFDEDGGTWFLVMEHVDGDDLSQRLKRGPVPVDEAINICRQIAEGLEAAHARGIIHRDLKPANIKLDSEGKVKVLDFGLAKATVGHGGDVGVDSDSPTVTDAFTRPGTILGTAAYMSPEQAKGKSVDERADVWAFGCVLYECLTGRRAFAGEDTTETLASIIKGEPDWSAIPVSTPPQVRWLLRKCLAKDRNGRLRDIADARIDLDDTNLHAEATSDTGSGSKRSRYFVSVLVLVALIGVILGWLLKPDTTQPGTSDAPRPQRHYSMALDMDGELARTNGSDVRLSPDGRMMGIIFHEEGVEKSMIYLKKRDEVSFKKLEGTEMAIDFDFSPDGEWIVFRREGPSPYYRIRTDFSGPPILFLGHDGASRGVSWSSDGIVFDSGSREIGLRFQGPDSDESTVLSGTEDGFRPQWPHALVGRRGALTTMRTRAVLESSATLKAPTTMWDLCDIVFVPYDGGEVKTILKGGYQGRYLPTKHLVYVHRKTLFAVPFDIDSFELRGTPVPVVQNIAVKDRTGVAHYDVSDDGVLAYLQGDAINEGNSLSWVSSNGERTALPREDFKNFRRFRLSPDGSRIAFVVRDSLKQRIIVYNITNDTVVLLVEVEEEDGFDYPVWSHDNQSIIFVSSTREVDRLYWTPVDGSRSPQLLDESDLVLTPTSWTRNGEYLALMARQRDSSDVNILVYQLSGGDKTGWTVVNRLPFRTTSAAELHPYFSPDGKWMAYYQEESQIGQSFVRSFPDGVKSTPIGGLQDYRVPRWLSDRDILLGGENIYKASFQEKNGMPEVGKPELWDHSETARMMTVPRSYDRFDVDEVNDRLLVRVQGSQTGGDYMLKRVMVFENFFDYVSEKVPYPEP